jgi:alpha-L-rhamnosidase
MFAPIGGIRQCVDSVGFRRVHIEPLLSWKLKSAEASMDTPCGVYSCRWRIMDPSHVEIRVTIPFGGEAELVLPGAKEKQPVRVLSAGEYSFAYETAEPFVKTLSTILPLGELLEEAEAREFLLSAVPQLSLINKSMQGTPLRDILLFAAGFEGLPSRDEMENRVLPELDEKLQLLEVSK